MCNRVQSLAMAIRGVRQQPRGHTQGPIPPAGSTCIAARASPPVPSDAAAPVGCPMTRNHPQPSPTRTPSFHPFLLQQKPEHHTTHVPTREEEDGSVSCRPPPPNCTFCGGILSCLSAWVSGWVYICGQSMIQPRHHQRPPVTRARARSFKRRRSAFRRCRRAHHTTKAETQQTRPLVAWARSALDRMGRGSQCCVSKRT